MTRVAGAGQTLSGADRRRLLQVAREAIVAHLAGRAYRPPAADGALAEARGAFVSLHGRAEGDLRGCVGRLESDEPLVVTVARMAVAAAVHDGRFDPVRREELDRLWLEVSALGELRPIRPEEIEVGKDGLIVSCSGRRGVLLPQVAVEHGWDADTFLDRTCGKAGLPAGAWRRPEASLQAFTAEVFGEETEG